MKLDRALQRTILQMLAVSYPAPIHPNDFNPFLKQHDERSTAANLMYLHQHGLITKPLSIGADHHISYACPAATMDGMDFLEDDGGLSAILGVVTVKLHEDTIKSLIETRIEESADIDAADKPRYVDALRALPADATKHLTMKLLDAAVTHAPGALHLIRTALHLT
ncbi:hypothetical protein ACQUFY_08305 [Robbsia andropogonis]|uniref:hypothetical protein n=1 Tax=Robbsia andropogonis TaxID=28092 RepID=UPI003D20B9BD